MMIAGMAGIVLRAYRFDPTPLIFTMVIAPMMEMSFRQGLIVARGNLKAFFIRPTAGLLWIVIVMVILSPLARRLLNYSREGTRNKQK
jgi:TctA family transporter